MKFGYFLFLIGYFRLKKRSREINQKVPRLGCLSFWESPFPTISPSYLSKLEGIYTAKKERHSNLCLLLIKTVKKKYIP